jgi:hypothetical protein
VKKKVIWYFLVHKMSDTDYRCKSTFGTLLYSRNSGNVNLGIQYVGPPI